MRLNVTNPAEVNGIFQEIVSKHGHLDILVNNAGVEDISPFIKVTEAQYDKIMGVNLRGAFFTAQAAARIMKGQKSGKILNIGSLGSAIGLSESSVYCGTKGGILGITRTMAIELARDNVQAVSYTHLDVYKRQMMHSAFFFFVPFHSISLSYAFRLSMKRTSFIVVRDGSVT